MSEIDEIFAAKTKTPSKMPKNKRHADVPAAANPQPDEDIESQSKKRPLPETVIDPSSHVTHSKRRKAERAHTKPKNKQAPAKDNGDEAKFKDSRGSASRRTTEEGWPIYKEDELGIRNYGGDTPLCPFDCNCCF